MSLVVVYMPFPPSVNAYYRAVNNMSILSKRGRQYQVDASAAIRAQGKPKFVGKCWLQITLFPPDLRERDSDNYNKALFDSLVKGGVIEKDSNRIVVGHSVDWAEKDAANPRAEIIIAPPDWRLVLAAEQ
jgi:crossover junction endodeoxyribonuclease RusA